MEQRFKNLVEVYMDADTVIEDQWNTLTAEAKTAKESLTLYFHYLKEEKLFQITLVQEETEQYWHESWVDFSKQEEDVLNQIQTIMNHLFNMVHYTKVGE